MKNKNRNVIPDTDIEQVIAILEEMYPAAGCALVHQDPYQLIISVVLSAQATDVSVNKATPALFAKYPTPSALADADQADVIGLIRAIGLYKTKSANIIKLAQKLEAEYGGEVPSDFDSLVSLPGVGRKTANVVLAEGFGVQRIAVDTHVFRVANRIGLTDAKDVNATEDQLMQRLPEDKWRRTHHLLIFHGRRCCSARKPDCENCRLNELCLFYRNNKDE